MSKKDLPGIVLHIHVTVFSQIYVIATKLSNLGEIFFGSVYIRLGIYHSLYYSIFYNNVALFKKYPMNVQEN